MELQQKYNDYINNILKSRGRFNCIGYKERHNIVPRCLGGSNNKDNLIDLYAEEHYIAHKLLALEQPDNKSLINAWMMMAYPKSSTQQRKYEISPEDYAFLRKQWSHHMKISNPGLDENGHPWNYGIPMTEEQKIKLSKSKKGVLLGPNSEETKRKKSLAAKKRAMEHPESYAGGNKDKKCITNGIDVKYISINENIPEGWRFGNCKTACVHDMTNYYSNPELQRKKSEQNSGKRNPMYGNGHRVSGGRNGHATKWYKIDSELFDCRKDLITYLNKKGIVISNNALRNIENKSYGNTTIKRFKYVIDNLTWGYKNENKIN